MFLNEDLLYHAPSLHILKPACSFRNSSSPQSDIPLIITNLAQHFYNNRHQKLIPRQFPHLVRSPFLASLTIRPFLQSAETAMSAFSSYTVMACQYAVYARCFTCVHTGERISDLCLIVKVKRPVGISSVTSVAIYIGHVLWVGSVQLFFPSQLFSTSFVNNLPAVFLTMSVLLGCSLHSLLVISYTPFICPRSAAFSVSWAMLLAHSLFSFRILLITS